MSAKDRVANNLVVLGAAAVLTVYAAGYARTQPAAQRFEDEGLERRPPPPTPKVDVPLRTVEQPDAPRVEKAAPVAAAAMPKAQKSVAPVDSAKAAEPVATAAAPAAPPVAPPAALLPTAPTPAPDTARPMAAAPVADTATKPAEPVTYKDGVYFAWGTSRHGDVQMGVEIKGGRISSAFISECYTQYDCSWIAHLPKQVVARQSADVDFVSGATHSANALYKAVVAALKQAK